MEGGKDAWEMDIEEVETVMGHAGWVCPRGDEGGSEAGVLGCVGGEMVWSGGLVWTRCGGWGIGCYFFWGGLWYMHLRVGGAGVGHGVMTLLGRPSA